MDESYHGELLYSFLERWPLEEVKKMTLDEYVSIGNKDTFCQWVETKTRMLGSIKGMTSIKFGIYQRKENKQPPKNYVNDDQYSWLKGYGDDRDIAFKKVKQDIIQTIKYAEEGAFDRIDSIILPDLYKWKVAFLYSNDRLIPVFKRDVLFEIAQHYGLKTTRKTGISQIQEVLMANKPSNLDVYQYMLELMAKFGNKEREKRSSSKQTKKKRAYRRKGTNQKSTDQKRLINPRSYFVDQKHNKIQNALYSKLVNQYGAENVILEENFVDVKLIQPDCITFYEVKTASYASECLRQAIGQLLLYNYHDEDKRKKNLVVVGQYPANLPDESFLKFINNILKVNIEYLAVSI